MMSCCSCDNHRYHSTLLSSPLSNLTLTKFTISIWLQHNSHTHLNIYTCTHIPLGIHICILCFSKPNEVVQPFFSTQTMPCFLNNHNNKPLFMLFIFTQTYTYTYTYTNSKHTHMHIHAGAEQWVKCCKFNNAKRIKKLMVFIFSFKTKGAPTGKMEVIMPLF